MVLKRIIPCLLIKNKRLVKTINYKNPSYIGDPVNAIKIYNSKEVDELIILDINATQKNKIDFDLLQDIAIECFMPLAYGGGVKSINDFKKLYSMGIEKVIVNSLLFENPSVVLEASVNFGSQSVVASVDVKQNSNHEFEVYSYSNKSINMSLTNYLTHITNLNVGEVFISSVDKEGTWEGYNHKLFNFVNELVNIPIIANGGCGCKSDLKSILYDTGIQAAAIGSMAVYQKKNMGVLIRFPKRNEIIKDE